MARKFFYNDITILKAIATILITWYHFKWTVPEPLAPLFVGGAFGNSLFFFCSGYLLKCGEEKYRGQWILKKYFRIMPVIWITYLLFCICLLCRGQGMDLPNWYEWIYPARYWFVCNILLYFFFMWLTNPIWKNGNLKLQRFCIKLSMFFVGIVQILWYVFLCDHNVVNIDEGYFKAWFFMIFFLWGYYERITNSKVSTSICAYLNVGISIVLFFVYKKVSEMSNGLAAAQVIFVPLLLAYVLHSFRALACHFVVINVPVSIKRFIIFLSNMTLEMYVVQVFFINWIMPIYPFPINILVSLIVILLAACCVHQCVNFISRKIDFI